jgi:hypothetical protein
MKMNGHLLRRAIRDLRTGGADILLIRRGGSHDVIVARNAHGRVVRFTIPRGTKHSQGRARDNARAAMRRQPRLLPGELDGGRHA